MELADFTKSYKDVAEFLSTEGRDAENEVIFKWYKKALDYNVPDGKKILGMTLLKTFATYAPPELVTKENIRLAHFLGWCVELVESAFLVTDDAVDEAEVRRGKLCWHQLENVGCAAVNDIVLIENGVFIILQKFFKKHKFYVELTELFLEVINKVIIGKTLASFSAVKRGPLKFENYNAARYESITNYMNGYLLYLPVAAGLYLSGIGDEKIHESFKPVMFKLGNVIQVQEDYAKCFGDAADTFDIIIETGGITWMIVEAMKSGSSGQKNILKENYGKSDKAQIAKVKGVYEELQLHKVYQKHVADRCNEISKLISDLRKSTNADVFSYIVDHIHQKKSK